MPHCGVSEVWLVVRVALGLMMQLSTLGRNGTECFCSRGRPLCTALFGRVAVLWGPLHQTARLADELSALPLFGTGCVFPSLQRLRDGAFLWRYWRTIGDCLCAIPHGQRHYGRSVCLSLPVVGRLWVEENALVLSSVSVGGGVRIDVVIGHW